MERRFRIRNSRRGRRVKHVRKRVAGTLERPRLAVYRSNKQIYAQAIDDFTGVTLASSSSMDSTMRVAEGTKTDKAKAVGADLAKRLKDKGVEKVVFDRRWYKFHGRVKALAEGAREAGLQF